MNASTRNIAVFTATRAEYGLLSNLVRRLAATDGVDVRLLVSGTHLSRAFGMTVTEIEQDACAPIGARVELPLEDPSPAGVCRAMGAAMDGYGKALTDLAPDLMVVLGDRYETLCAAAAAQVCCVPVAHIQGGETTEGAVDEAFRHAITKMAHLHFPSCEVYRRRIIQLGEHPERVFNVGALGVENIHETELIEPAALARELEFDFTEPFFLVTYHPVTLEKDAALAQVRELTAALDAFPNHRILFTYANADPGGRAINERIDAYVREDPSRRAAFASMGKVRYLSALRCTAAVIGNSSSGIIEAPSFHVPTVDIGDRQRGRVRAASVLHAAPDRASIRASIEHALSGAFRAELDNVLNPYDRPGTAARIAEVLSLDLLQGIMKKAFHDL